MFSDYSYQLKNIPKKDFDRLLLSYEFGLDEIMTKIKILQKEFSHIHSYNPIEYVKSRLKTTESIFEKLQRKDFPLSIASIRDNVKDVAGIRIVCSFKSDIYRVAQLLISQPDLQVIEYKDYIIEKKANGYQSLHMILSVPVFLSDRVLDVPVEIQIRTIAMDFWASLEHKIYYKHRVEDPPKVLTDELKKAATTVSTLDSHMESIHKNMQKYEIVDPKKFPPDD
ncbi:MAG: GTP pyrophosphokinase family protein [Clostridia bacterium]